MTHRDIFTLLPWYLNETLTPQERRSVEAHMADCPACRKELGRLKVLRTGVAELNEAIPAPSPDLLARALRDVEAFELEKTKRRHRPAGEIQSMTTRLEAFLTSWWRPIPVFARVAIAIQLVLVVGMGGMIVSVLNRPAPFMTLVGPPSSTERPEGRARLVIGFQPGATDAEIRRTLQEIRGVIVHGPSALGLYTVELPFGSDQPLEIDRTIELLKKNREIVRFAERES